MVQALAQGLDISLDSPVARVEWSGRNTSGHGGMGERQRGPGDARFGGSAEGGGQRKRLREEEEEEEEEEALMADKEESCLCVGSFVSYNSGAGTLTNCKAEQAAAAGVLPEGWKVSAEFKKGRMHARSKVDSEITYTAPSQARFKSAADVRRFLQQEDSAGQLGQFGQLEQETQADTLAFLGKKLRCLCKVELADAMRRACERRILLQLGLEEAAKCTASPVSQRSRSPAAGAVLGGGGQEEAGAGEEGGEREASPLLPSLRSVKWLEEEEEVLVLERGGERVEVKVGSDVEMLFSDGVWYRGWIAKWLGEGKKPASKGPATHAHARTRARAHTHTHLVAW